MKLKFIPTCLWALSSLGMFLYFTYGLIDWDHIYYAPFAFTAVFVFSLLSGVVIARIIYDIVSEHFGFVCEIYMITITSLRGVRRK